jgi:hypothetical protein
MLIPHSPFKMRLKVLRSLNTMKISKNHKQRRNPKSLMSRNNNQKQFIMRKLFVFFVLLSCVEIVQAQRQISVTGGVKMIGSEQKLMTLWYVDESPSRDNIYTNVDPVGKYNVDLSVRFRDVSGVSDFNLFADIQGYIGSVLGLALNAGYVYGGNGQRKVKLEPELAGSLGFSRLGMGEIVNNDVYIAVNQTQFADNTDVFVAVNNIYLGVKPGLSLSTELGNGKKIGFRANYQLSLKFGRLGFSGTGQDGNPASDSESLSAENVGFYADGVKTTKVPFNPDGLEFKLFYTF